MTPDYGKIGFFGLGAMGRPMVENLAKDGYPLIVYDVNKNACQGMEEYDNVEIAESPEQIAKKCKVILLSVPNSKIVTNVLLNPQTGLIRFLREGTTIIDMTSSNPLDTKKTGEALAAAKINFLDAPVSGAPLGAINKTLAVMVGGEKELYDQYLPLFKSMGSSKIHYVGKLANGHAIKALNNLLSSITFVATGEVLILGKKLGLSPAVMLDVFNSSTSRSYTTEIKFPKYILSRTFDAKATVETFYKDIENALDCAKDELVSQYIGGINEQMWRNAMSKGLGKEDYTILIKLMEEVAGVEIID